MPKTMRLVVQEFLNSDHTMSLAKTSRNKAAYVTDHLLKVTSPNLPVARLTAGHIDTVLSYWRGYISDATMNTYRGNLRTFGKYLFDHGYTKTNVAGHLRNQRTKTDYRKRKQITVDQARHMIKLGYERHPRDGITLVLLVTTGLRESELCGLTWSDIDFEDQSLTAYRPKVRDYHTVPLAPQAIAALNEWRTWVMDHEGPIDPDWYVACALAYRCGPGNQKMHPEWPLAPTRPQTQLGPHIKGLLRAVGETDLNGRGTHVLRRFAAEYVLTMTGNVRDAQTLLGHASSVETERYLDRDAARERLRENMRDWRI